MGTPFLVPKNAHKCCEYNRLSADAWFVGHSTGLRFLAPIRGFRSRGLCDVTACRYTSSETCPLRWVRYWVHFIGWNPELVEIMAAWARLPRAIREAMTALRRTTGAKR